MTDLKETLARLSADAGNAAQIGAACAVLPDPIMKYVTSLVDAHYTNQLCVVPSVEVIAEAEARGWARAESAIVAYLRNQEAKGAKIANQADEGSTRWEAYGGGSYALHLAANNIEAEDMREWLTMCIGCDMPIGHKAYAVDDNGETGCPAVFTDDGSGECWNHNLLTGEA